MLQLTSIQFKAALLCIVFASNSILGFACTVGVDMALLQRIIHHNKAGEETEASIHVHADSKKHHHHEKHATEKDDCCNKKVVSFEQLDKIISHSVTANFALPIFELLAFLLLNTTIHPSISSTVFNYTASLVFV
ncbi:MAG: hypothetical protein M3Z26_16290 [Bacteroidota bacterium]|nr:hypothetical protein [Bacteroidota bacterium]